MFYGHVMTDQKIAAQGSMLERIMPRTVVGQQRVLML
jgi:hypothetical protein